MNFLYKKILLVLTLLICATVGFHVNDVKAATSGDYTIKPENGDGSVVNTDGGFYLVKGQPGQTTDVKVNIFNTSKETRQFLVSLNTAYTTSSGQPAFDSSRVKDPNLKIQLRKCTLNNDQVVSIDGNKNQVVTFKLKIPEQKYVGYLMGGVNVSPYHEKAKGTVTENGTLIKNKFSYSIPVQVKQADSPNSSVHYKIDKVIPKIVNSANGKSIGVAATVSNTANSFLTGLDAKAVITKYGNKNFKKVQSQSAQSIAPTSHYEYGVNWGKDRLQAGKYHIKLTYNGNNVKSWTLDKDFTITDSQANKFNKLAGFKPNYLWLYIILAILLLALILGLGLYLGKRGQKSDSNNQLRSRKSRRRRR